MSLQDRVMCPGKDHCYSDLQPATRDVYNAAFKWIVECIDKIQLEKGEPFVLCDYGSADGGASMDLMCQVIGYVKTKYGEDQQVHIIYEDLAQNNFNGLFQKVHGPNSYLKSHSKVYVTVCGTEFYSQVLPDSSVNIGITSTAMHWLTKSPCELRDSLFPFTTNYPEDKAKFAEQAAKDWETNLLHRSKELKPGGHLVFMSLCTDNDGRYYASTTTHDKQESVMRLLSFIWRAMANEGLIEEKEFLGANSNMYFSTIDEMIAPFNKMDSEVKKAGLNLIKIEVKTFECSHLLLWNTKANKEDEIERKDYATNVVQACRTWSEFTLRFGLSSHRSMEEKEKLIDELYSRMVELIAKDPANVSNDVVSAYLHIEKKM